MAIITLTTDFGNADGYAGIMKGVILSICPDARLVDLSHAIEPQNVRQAAFVLHTAVPYFPAGTIHLAVVDPGVGSRRRPIAVQTPSGIFVGPDNGIFSFILAEFSSHHNLTAARTMSIVELTRMEYWLPSSSHTFHGRDIFAPVAAHLARGVPLANLGEPIDDPVIFPIPQPEIQPDGRIIAHILHIDRFGNLVTDIQVTGPWASLIGARTIIEIAGKRILGVHQTFADVAVGELVAYVGSSGYLEIGVRHGNAAMTLNLRPGDKIILE